MNNYDRDNIEDAGHRKEGKGFVGNGKCTVYKAVMTFFLNGPKPKNQVMNHFEN